MSNMLPPLAASLHCLGIGSPDPEALAQFYAETIGFAVEERGSMLVGTGPDRRMAFLAGDAKSLQFAGFAVASAQDLQVLKQRLAAAGHALSAPGAAAGFFEPGAIACEDPDGNLLVFGLPRAVSTAPPGMAARLQHVVVASADAARLSAFYVEVLGFAVSDLVLDDEGGLRTSFLRCSPDHHSVAIFQARTRWFDHHCYETTNWNMIRDWGDHFARAGVPVVWGPGRHGPGNNLFLFIHDPDGNWLEISTELEQVASDRPTGFWPHAQSTLNLWGSAPLRS